MEAAMAKARKKARARSRSASRKATARRPRQMKTKAKRRPNQKFTVNHHRDENFDYGLRPYSAYRDLGIAPATGGMVQAHVIRMTKPFDASEVAIPHYHDIDFQMDRKSTRLNSSHMSISYAVFCLKKKKKKKMDSFITPSNETRFRANSVSVPSFVTTAEIMSTTSTEARSRLLTEMITLDRSCSGV